MSKFVTIGLVLGALAAGILASLAPTRAALNPAMSAACWEQVHQKWPGYGSDGGKDRMREFLFDACMQNGGRIP